MCLKQTKPNQTKPMGHILLYKHKWVSFDHRIVKYDFEGSLCLNSVDYATKYCTASSPYTEQVWSSFAHV